MNSQKSKIISGNSRVVRNINRSVILNIIRQKQPISRVKIARLTNLNKSTVSTIVTRLLEEKLLCEEQIVDKNVGRNPYHLTINAKAHFVGGLYIDSRKTQISIFDIAGHQIGSAAIKTESGLGEKFIALCIDKLNELQHEHSIAHLKGIGVSVAGIVDPVNATVLHAPSLGWDNFAIGEIIKRLFPSMENIKVENGGKASALAELWFGNQQTDLKDFVFLSVSSGLGTGIVIDQKLVDGVHYSAGEFGHLTLFEGGESCSCGNRGCWEAYASDKSTVQRYMLKTGKMDNGASPIAMQDIIHFARNGEEAAIQILEEKGHYLGLGIAGIVKVIDPQKIIVGGKVTQVWDLIYPHIDKVVKRKSFLGQFREIIIEPSTLTLQPRLLGAATLAIKEIFSDFRITV
ncbi:ROK family protein [candidate division KSB1 bacterium]|nr:ROK family protein [candidate division KSB1 bacterium]